MTGQKGATVRYHELMLSLPIWFPCLGEIEEEQLFSAELRKPRHGGLLHEVVGEQPVLVRLKM